jgi:ABC-type transport system involved in cytochrome bd biosynthesis fused ATPase/permease subunit
VPEVDEIIMLDEGEILEMGSYDQLIKNNSYFARFIANQLNPSLDDEPEAKVEANSKGKTKKSDKTKKYISKVVEILFTIYFKTHKISKK